MWRSFKRECETLRRRTRRFTRRLLTMRRTQYRRRWFRARCWLGLLSLWPRARGQNHRPTIFHSSYPHLHLRWVTNRCPWNKCKSLFYRSWTLSVRRSRFRWGGVQWGPIYDIFLSISLGWMICVMRWGVTSCLRWGISCLRRVIDKIHRIWEVIRHFLRNHCCCCSRRSLTRKLIKCTSGISILFAD